MMVVNNQREGHREIENLFFGLRWFIIMFSTLWVLIPWRLTPVFAATLMQFPEKSKMLLVSQVGVLHKAWGSSFQTMTQQRGGELFEEHLDVANMWPWWMGTPCFWGVSDAPNLFLYNCTLIVITEWQIGCFWVDSHLWPMPCNL